MRLGKGFEPLRKIKGVEITEKKGGRLAGR
jgi:hypothetical protein